ncbi:MAG: hypothetical protein PWP23_1842 [Candidatus Sumerlaeota bacterium]|nr:hypothetical protein [Candidatus Sumerlaeota bacterium]
MSEFLILPHVVAGALGTILTLVLAGLLLRSAKTGYLDRALAWLVPALYALSFAAGGFWYLNHYDEGKAAIKAGPVPWAHGVVMETKEHVFLGAMLLALLVPVAVAEARQLNSVEARRMAAVVCALAGAMGLAMEGMGAVVSMAIRISAGGA